jgi:hypothetical protein
MGQVFREAMNGQSKERPELAETRCRSKLICR